MACVLVVDDEKSIRLTLGQLLRQAGHEVETAEDAAVARGLLERSDFDVVVTDIILPRVSGVTLLKSIHAADPDLPVIMMTGEPTVETAVEAVRDGAHDYLCKPVSKDLILVAVDRAARWKALLDDRKRLEAANREYQGRLEAKNQAMLQARRDLQTLNEELEERILQRTAALEREQAERVRVEQELVQAQKMEALGRLAGGVAHDFSNFLMPIMTYSDLLLSKLCPGGAPRPDDPLARYAAGIAKAAERAAALPRQLMAFCRKQVIQPVVLDVDALLTEMAKMLRRVIGEDIAFAVAARAQGISIRADRGHVEQVLMNLVLNARDAMPHGGQLTIESCSVVLDEEYVRPYRDLAPGRYALLTVSDTGCGMDEMTQQRIFEPFFTTKEKGKGTGLGLATVYGTVKQNRGHVEVSSAPGQGAAFRIYLPAVEEAVEPAEEEEEEEEEAAPQGLAGRGETVLVVEDEEVVRSAAVMVLSDGGYRVLESSGWGEALETSEREQGPIHLLLTDVVMPGRTGLEVADLLCQSRPGMRVLYMSGHADDALERAGLSDESIALLRKPFTPGALTRKVREVLDGERRAEAQAGPRQRVEDPTI